MFIDMLPSAARWRTDKNLMSMTGKVLMTCDLARRYGLKDIDGTESSVAVDRRWKWNPTRRVWCIPCLSRPQCGGLHLSEVHGFSDTLYVLAIHYHTFIHQSASLHVESC